MLRRKNKWEAEEHEKKNSGNEPDLFLISFMYVTCPFVIFRAPLLHLSVQVNTMSERSSRGLTGGKVNTFCFLSFFSPCFFSAVVLGARLTFYRKKDSAVPCTRRLGLTSNFVYEYYVERNIRSQLLRINEKDYNP